MPENLEMASRDNRESVLQARIEKLRADAINALQNANVTSDDATFQRARTAVDALLQAQGQVPAVPGPHSRRRWAARA